MKVVIDIPEKYLNTSSGIIDATLFTGENNTITDVNIEDTYAKFQVLPKGHGDLVDISKLYEQKCEQRNPFVEFLGEEYVSTGAIETYATVIIPADKGDAKDDK